MTIIEEKFKFIQALGDSNEGEKACIEFFQLIKELEKIDSEELPYLYYKFAFLLFDNEFYEDCIIMFNNAYKHNYMRKEIKDFIFNSFIIPNSNEFKESYINNLNKYSSSNIALKNYEYKLLQLEFIPVSENKYYIYDLEKDTFDEYIDFNSENIENHTKIEFGDEFSDILLIDDYNINCINSYISENKRIYYFSLSPLKSLSFFKLPNIVDTYLKNVYIFEAIDNLKNYFTKNTSVYLPRIILDLKNNNDYFSSINKTVDDIHNSRLLSQNRDNSNVLLSICIPSWNRGHRALQSVRSLLNLKYDSEIEFVISNNGSDINVDGYREISDLNDSRISYYEFASNQGYLKNVCKVLDSAKGKFALLISDEDAINLTSLPRYMNILNNNNSIGVLRSGTSHHYRNLSQQHIKAGINAFSNFFLSNNYMSGVIYNTKIISENKLTDLIMENKDNNQACFHYAHMWLDAFITFKGDFYQDSSILCIEGISEDTISNAPKSSPSTINDDLLAYQHYESRIEQHYGFIDLLNKLPIPSSKLVIDYYIQICWKTIFLVSLVKDRYIKHNFNLDRIFDEIYNCCINGISKLDIIIDDDLFDKIKNLIQGYIRHYKS